MNDKLIILGIIFMIWLCAMLINSYLEVISDSDKTDVVYLLPYEHSVERESAIIITVPFFLLGLYVLFKRSK